MAGLLWLTDAAGTDRVASATRADGKSVTLAMPIGRNRTVTLSTMDARRTLVLPDDTGWWRGSQLYRTADDGLLLNDGQGGCVNLAGPARPCPP